VDNYAKVRGEPRNVMQKIQLSELTLRTKRQPFVTIDDLARLANELQVGLNKLGEFKYPLGIRRGVRKVINDRGSMTIKSIGRMYFLDIKITKVGNPYLVITESRSKRDSEEKERSSIVVFQENAREFADAVANMVSKINIKKNGYDPI
jgi:hypothetical protein